MSRDLKLSVIVPSYNRREEIAELLASLEAQDLAKDRFEVVVVDDGSTDGTAEMLAELQKKTDLSLSVLHQDHRGPGAARNAGMEKASGDLFVFIDSDCLAPPQWLSTIKHAFDQDPELAAFGGRDDARLDFPPLLLAINYSMTSFLTTGGMRGRKKRLAKFYPRSFNMGLTRNLYRQIGGFSSLRHGQDIEFSNRILKSGAKTAYLHDAAVYHKRRTSLQRFFRQVFNWGAARINLFLIDRRMLEPLHILPALAMWGWLLFSLAALCVPLLRRPWVLATAAGAAAVLISALHAGIRYKSARVALLTPLVMPLQIFGYGLGFTVAFVRRVILKKGEYTGFVKRYYS